jgi:hypothetical protein
MEKGILPGMMTGAVLISRKTGIPIGMGGTLHPGPNDAKEDKWGGPLPKGWTDKSRSSFYDNMGGDECEEGPTQACMDKIDGHVDDPGAFCASLRDRVTGTTLWRGSGK